MGRKRARRYQKLYLGEWITRLGRRPVEIANAVDIGESYMSLLISGKRDNPKAGLLYEIAQVLGIRVDDLFHPPPSPDVIEAVGRLTPTQMSAIGQLLDDIKRPRRK